MVLRASPSRRNRATPEFHSKPLAAAVVTIPGPRREQEEDPSALRGSQRVPLVRVEAEEGADAGRGRLLAGTDLHVAIEHGHPGVLLHLVIAKLLPRVQDDQDRTRLVS